MICPLKISIDMVWMHVKTVHSQYIPCTGNYGYLTLLKQDILPQIP